MKLLLEYCFRAQLGHKGSRVTNALLVGLGSVGKTHLKALTSRFESIFIVEPRPEARREIEYLGSRGIWIGSINELDSLPDRARKIWDFVVVANWAPDRLETIRLLRGHKIRALLIEKPATSSLSDVYKLEKEVSKLADSAAVNLHLRYSKIPQIVSEVTEKFSLGPIIRIVEIGGAKCIGTNGIHWLDLATFLFKENAIEVQGNTRFDAISPRGKHLNVAEGDLCWKFANGATFRLTYSNRSSIPSQLFIQWRHASASIIESELILKVQQKKIIESNEPLTRTPPYDLVAKFNDLYYENSTQSTFIRLYEDLMQNKLSFYDFTNSSKYLFMGFIAAEKNKRISLHSLERGLLRHPILSRKDWKIT